MKLFILLNFFNNNTVENYYETVYFIKFFNNNTVENYYETVYFYL